jgi:hypothetical protein
MAPPGEAWWTDLTSTSPPLLAGEETCALRCPFRGSAEGTDDRGPHRGHRGVYSLEVVGADRPANHPPCCPLNLFRGDGTVHAHAPTDLKWLRADPLLLP